MELGPSLAPELLLAADPLSRGPPDFRRPSGRVPDADSGPAPFDLLLQLLGNSLPLALPGGETLPLSGGGSASGSVLTAAAAPAAGLGAAVPAGQTGQTGLAGPLALELPLPRSLGGTGALSASAATATATATDSPAALADALRLALAAGAPQIPASAPRVASPAGAMATVAGMEQAATQAPPAPPLPTPPETLGLPADAPRALHSEPAAAVSAPLEAFAARIRGAGESRPRATGSAGERALAFASELARADVANAVRTDSQARALDVAAQASSAAAPVPLRSIAAWLDESPAVGLVAAAEADSPLGSIPSAFTSVTAQGTSSTQASPAAPTGQLPPHLAAPVDAHAARWHEALASRIQWLVDHEIGEAQIKLNPPELGALDVKISMLDDKTYVQMTAHTSAGRDELSQSLPRLRELMSASGLDLGGATVSDGRDQGSGRQAAASPVVRAALFAPSVEAPAESPRSRLGSSSAIDLFA
jgi:flagellar hook-length control protein FliK